jgi:hypothetical protein
MDPFQLRDAILAWRQLGPSSEEAACQAILQALPTGELLPLAQNLEGAARLTREELRARERNEPIGLHSPWGAQKRETSGE